MDACQRKLALGQGFYNTGQYVQKLTYLNITYAHMVYAPFFPLGLGRLNVMSTRLGG